MGAELSKGESVACIDLTSTKPTLPVHPFRSLPNVVLTPRVAGAIGKNRLRLGAMTAHEVLNFFESRPLQLQVTQDVLAGIA